MARPACLVEPGIREYAERVMGDYVLDRFSWPIVRFSDELKWHKEYYITKDSSDIEYLDRYPEREYPNDYRRDDRRDFPEDDFDRDDDDDPEDYPEESSDDPGSCMMLRLGEYIPNENKIIIYEKAHGYDKPGEEDKKETYIRQTIAHELFHAIHYYLAPKTCRSGDTEAHVVKEALADYFSYSFSMNERVARHHGYDYSLSSRFADKRYKFWRRNLSRGLSYAHAIYIEKHPIMEYSPYRRIRNWMKIEGEGFLRLLHILEMSKYDMYSAYALLVPERERRIQPRGTYRPDDYVVVEVEFTHGYGTWYSYLLDPTERREVKIADKLVVTSNYGKDKYVTVRNVMVMDKFRYEKYLARKCLPDLKEARRG